MVPSICICIIWRQFKFQMLEYISVREKSIFQFQVRHHHFFFLSQISILK